MITIKNFFLCFFVILFSASCVKDSTDFVLNNNSTVTYHSVQIFVSPKNRVVLSNVKPNDVRSGKIVFDPKDKKDGCYKIILFKENDLIKKTCFGYYTNGTSLNRNLKISIIDKDSIIIHQFSKRN